MPTPPLPPITTHSLGLEDDDDEDEEHPRRWVSLPCNSLLTYGGDNGNIALWNKTDDTYRIVQRFDDGIRAVAASADGKRIAVGFDTGTTRIYTFDDYTKSSDEEHPFISSKGDHSNDNLLLSQDLSLLTPSNYWLAQFDAPIRDLLFLDDNNWLMVAYESGGCAIHARSKDSLKERALEHEIRDHHDHCGIRGVAFHNGKLATLAMDGRLCVWDWEKRKLLHRETSLCIPKADVGEVHGASAFDRSCRPTMYQNYVATPGQLAPVIRIPGTTKVLEIEGGDDNDDGHMDSIVCLIPFHTHWVSSGRDGRIVFWKSIAGKQKKLMAHTKVSLESPATDLWVDGTRVVCACAKGTGAIVDFKDVLETIKSSDAQETILDAQETPTIKSNTRKSDSKEEETAATQKEDDEDDDDDDEDFGSDSKPAKSKKRILKTANQDDEDDDDEDLGGRDSKTTPKRSLKKAIVDDDDDDDDDVDFGSSSQPSKAVRFIDDEAADDDDDEEDGKVDNNKQQAPKTSTATDLDDDRMPVGTNNEYLEDDDDMDDDDVVPRFHPTQQQQRLPPAQPAFSPSSTPLDLPRRFLCWNQIGAITMLQGGDRNTIDITFTDSAYKRPISFTDNIHFLLGSLGDDGGIFASDLQQGDDDDDDDNNPDLLDDLNMSERTKQAIAKSHKKRVNAKPTGSSIFFYRFETFGNMRDKDWYLTLPDGERVLGSACGGGWAAVMTSRRFLRLFTSGGNQSQVVWLKGDPVTMTGRSRFLAVFYHEATPLLQDGTQQLGYTLWDAAQFKVVSQGSVSCISKGSSLTWVGFSNDCSLMAMDSDGMLSMLVPCGDEGDNWEWSPVLDTVGLRKSADDQFWPVTVYDGKLVCVPLKGGTTYPDAARRPVTSTLGLRMPLAKASVAKNTALEELSVRSNIALNQKKIVNDMGTNDDSTEDFEQTYLTLCAQVDKVTLKLFVATVDAGKVERALDLVDRLHLEKSYDLAIQFADHHRKLADLIEDAKERKFAEDDEDDYDDNGSPSNTFFDRLAPASQISPDASQTSKIKRSMGHPEKSMVKKVRLG